MGFSQVDIGGAAAVRNMTPVKSSLCLRRRTRNEHDLHIIGMRQCAYTCVLQIYYSVSGTWHAMPETMQTVAKYGAFILPAVVTGMTSTFPAALCYYWTCSNVYSIGVEFFLRMPAGASLAPGWHLIFIDNTQSVLLFSACLRGGASAAMYAYVRSGCALRPITLF